MRDSLFPRTFHTRPTHTITHTQIAIISSLLLVFAGGRGTLGAPGVLFRQRLDAKDPLPPSVRAKIQIPAEAAHHHHHRLLSSSAYSNIDFSGFAVGDVVTDLGNGVTVSATKRLPDDTFEDGVAMIFDTANPTGGDWDLGAPHKSYGGPGLGKWGRKRGMLFPNSEPRGYSLIISENGDGTDPGACMQLFLFRVDFRILFRSSGGTCFRAGDLITHFTHATT